MSYHMRRANNEIKDWATIEEIIHKGKFTTLSLCRNNEPYGVVLNYGYDKISRALYFHCALEGLKTEFVRENNSACATIFEEDSTIQGLCVYAYRSVVIRGKIEIVTGEKEMIHGLNVLLDHLEDDTKIKKEMMPSGTDMKKVAIWKLTFDEFSGKEMKG
jgi:nitroimidazol reductase NimA-like FMN-containing flavoprotein (pyridoxamine 5'-phosphate oxidase superfamily)